MDEVRLVRSAQQGSAEAFEQLALRYQQVLAASARYTVGNRDDAEDAVQDTLVRAYRHLPSLKDPGKFRVWLLSILRHVCLTLLQKRAPAAGSLEDYSETLAAPEPPADHDITDALAQLPLAYREVLIAHYLQGLSYAEMARVFDATEEALRVRCLRAREALRKYIRQAEEEEMRQYMQRALALALKPTNWFLPKARQRNSTRGTITRWTRSVASTMSVPFMLPRRFQGESELSHVQHQLKTQNCLQNRASAGIWNRELPEISG